VLDGRLWHHAPMLENRGVRAVPDTPENRQLWLSDFRNEELLDTLRTLLDAGFVQMILKDKE
jgi:hypothetical protein